MSHLSSAALSGQTEHCSDLARAMLISSMLTSVRKKVTEMCGNQQDSEGRLLNLQHFF